MFSFLGFGKKKKGGDGKEKEKESKESKKNKGRPDSARPTSASTNARNKRAKHTRSDKDKEKSKDIEIEVADIPIPDISDFFHEFFTIYSHCEDIKAKRSTVAQIKEICPKLVEPDTTLSREKLSTMGFDPAISNPIVEFLSSILEETPPRRARLTLALYRFSSVIDQELDDEAFTTGTGVLSGFLNANTTKPETNNNANLNPNCFLTGGSKRLKDSNGNLEIDLVSIYFKLLAGIYDQQYSSKDFAADPTAFLPEPVEVCFILEQVRYALRLEPNVITLALPTVVVGDIHGQAYDLLHHIIPTGGPLVHHEVLAKAKPIKVNIANLSHNIMFATPAAQSFNRKRWGGSDDGRIFPPPLPQIKADPQANYKRKVKGLPENYPLVDEPVRYLFLGDYVDRGSCSLHCLLLLCVAKLLDPQNVILLRGNHECGLTNKHYGFLEECLKLYPIDKDGSISKLTAPRTPKEVEVVNSVIRDPEDDFNNNNNTTSEWDLTDHPFWIKANRAFDCLPLCATLYEVVPITSEKTNHTVQQSSGVTPEERQKAGKRFNTNVTTEDEPNNQSGSSANPVLPVISSEETGDAKRPTSRRHRRREHEKSDDFYHKDSERKNSESEKEVTPIPEDPNAAGIVELIQTENPYDPGSPARVSGNNTEQRNTLVTNGSILEMRSIASSAENSVIHPYSTTTVHAVPTTFNKVRVCAMHGGLSPYIENSIDGIIAVNRFRDIEQGPLADLTWSDPITLKGVPEATRGTTSAKPTRGTEWEEDPAQMDPVLNSAEAMKERGHVLTVLQTNDSPPSYEGPPIGFTFSARGTGHNFGEDVTCLFLKHNRLDYIIRAHQCVQDGYQWVHQKRVLTVFSAPNYCGMGNKGAVLLLNRHAVPRVVQYQFVPSKDRGAGKVDDEVGKLPPKEFL